LIIVLLLRFAAVYPFRVCWPTGRPTNAFVAVAVSIANTDIESKRGPARKLGY
jgi:hypothetical protein